MPISACSKARSRRRSKPPAEVRIVLAHSAYRLPGGEDTYLRQQTELLRQSHDVHLLTRSNRDLSSSMGTAVRMTYSRKLVSEVIRELESVSPDVVHVHNVYPALGPAVHLAADRLQIPLVMTVHNYRLRCPNGYLFTEGSICTRCVGGNHLNAVIHRCFPSRSQAAAYATSLWVHRFVVRLSDRVDYFVTPSDFVRGVLEEWGMPRDRIRTIRNFTPSPPTVKPLGRSGIYIGRFSSEKGIDVLIRALELAGDPSFTFVGDGPLLTEMKDLTRSCGLTNSRFTGLLQRDEVNEEIDAAMFLCVPSIWHENAPMAALEAMARGRPMVAADSGGLPELIGRDRGIAVRGGDPGQLAEAIRSLFENPLRAEEMGRRARSYTEAEHAPRNHLAALEQVYDDARRLKRSQARSR